MRHAPRGRLLHGRIIRWFLGTIFATCIVVVTIFHAFNDNNPWEREQQRVRSFIAGQLARVWDDPLARHAMLAASADDLDVDFVLRDTSGTVLDTAGACTSPSLTVPVAGKGELVICAERHHFGPGWRLVVALFAAGIVVWVATGRIARRLARPITHLAEVARDIGDGRLTSRARLDCRELGEIGVLTQAVNDMAGKIERQMNDQRELLAAVSHELRTPLGRVRVIAELLQGTANPKRLEQLEREVVEMDRLVGDLLASARVDFSALNVRGVDAAELAGEALDRLGLSRTQLEVTAADTRIEGDATLLTRAVSNLIDNAQRHGRGLVKLALRERPGYLVVEAEDAGPGIDAAALAHLFEPFQRRAATEGEGSRATDDGRSLGLGLSLVRRIAEAHRGTAYAKNAEKGAVVGFEIARDGVRA